MLNCLLLLSSDLTHFRAFLAQWIPGKHQLLPVTIALLLLEQCSSWVLRLRSWYFASGRSGCLLTSLGRNLHMQEVTPAAGLVPLLDAKIDRQHQPTVVPVCAIKHPAEQPQFATKKIAIKSGREISAEFGGIMRRKACSSDPLWPLQLWRCCICLIPRKLRGWSDPPLIHKKKPPRLTQRFSWVSICLFSSRNRKNRKCFVCLLVETIFTTFFSWLEPLQSILKGLLGKATGTETWGHREKEQSYSRKPGSRNKTCCECCSDEQWDSYAQEWKRQKKSSDTGVKERLQVRTGMDVIRLDEGEGEMQ